MSSTTSAPSGDPGGVGGGRIRSLSAAASQEAWEMRKGLDGYCTYRSRAISGTSDAHGAPGPWRRVSPVSGSERRRTFPAFPEGQRPIAFRQRRQKEMIG